MGRPVRYVDSTLGRFSPGTFERIAAVLLPGEDRTEFFRIAVDHEIARRNRAKTVRARGSDD